MPRKKPANVEEYIAACPAGSRPGLAAVRAAIRAAAPGATERTDYFDIPGYSYPGYDYDGMFAWFSFKAPYVRLHVRPPVLQNHAKEVAAYATTKAVVSFPMAAVPVGLVKKLTRGSLRVMRGKVKASR